jgi:hypothetical protein
MAKSKRERARAGAKKKLCDHLKRHVNTMGCFNCSSKRNLQISHIDRAKKAANPRQMCCFVTSSEQKRKAAEIFKELTKCGILCRKCHSAYDNHYRYGHAKASFDSEYRRLGTQAGSWGIWKSGFLSLSNTLDSKIAAL